MTGIDEQLAQTPADETLDQLARAARALRTDGSSTSALSAVVTQAIETITPATSAGLIELEHGRLVPKATHGAAPLVLDHLQQQLGAGPCIDTARDQSVTVIDDTATDGRWPRFAAAAAEIGVRSMLCAPLWVDQRRLGTLSVYGPTVRAFGEAERRVAALYATLAALALADGQRVANLNLALDNRDIIGQAKGILIERHRLTAEAAFELLSKTSQNTNQKLLAVAETLIATGELPD
ncbi:GAF and ANTAR domain-containing protein [Actinoplanes sp. CA-030573]|uniref:GAF and ANTAR domain-containing protein n=1 Tax=Actinoplanes sp. CA-030573 TaxID=3239898 RepID=UPI003D8A836F